ncbi:NeuD/PglB/VioB family sugar acetyltransferase [Adlercreutzia sp. ZJ473]|uniref:NeuD/PglB/VioB family sugar acetyltransferase n=1 Tax=Adlercreutzia sp. ZJ473 TaxID=2722822 RepID=UPI001554EA8F|nr:NeuD/PglB/VioB family sugar acetyltransferase [Adlercreutzia sp. ZJ473]
MEKPKKLVLLGAGGMGREVAQLVERINAVSLTYALLGFVDDAGFEPGAKLNGCPVLGSSEWLVSHRNEVVCTCTIGHAATKEKLQARLASQGIVFESIVAPDVEIPDSTTIGPGCVFYPSVIVSVNCGIGEGVLLNSGVTVGHDSTIGDFTSIMPGTGISGNCHVGRRVNIGGHAFLTPGRKVGDDATVAAGSIVFNNVRKGTTVLGNPARRMRELEG